ncbi:uncharacterized protein HD556DRAFT_1440463 [Suillus plorans]|uniref:DUF6533 domain-containing protein n=1 Tax=Suillus plorans TaxID=116603 RepID=A0A9P7DLW5_9AGAM|nr:uncharacterized protein HD556DRAFT_1440463 [Suillus plorans]KAG1798128.1 hypothetical protein HD556DRAFT_1440463 [Suillus plorans]
MTIVSNDPTWWPTISAYHFSSYFAVATFAGVTYDWALTFGQEVELVWRQRWSLMTVLYLSVRYLGMLVAALYMVGNLPTISLTDTQWVCPLMAATLYYQRCWMMYTIWDWTGIVVFAMLWVIIITRLHAMYQRARKILISLIVTFLIANIFDGVIGVMTTMHSSGEEFILSGTYQCQINCAENIPLLISVSWILGIAWEVLALCLAVWIAVKHFREVRQHSTGGILEDCFAVLVKTHVLYFASFVAVSCFELVIDFSPTDQNSQENQTVNGLVQIFSVVQTFVLGPRLILGIREYHAKLVTDADAATGMTSIAFQKRVHISTGSSV